LQVNETVTTLNLQNNEIGDVGARALAEALQVNETITTLKSCGKLLHRKRRS